jgi:hypothetical protein
LTVVNLNGCPFIYLFSISCNPTEPSYNQRVLKLPMKTMHVLQIIN